MEEGPRPSSRLRRSCYHILPPTARRSQHTTVHHRVRTVAHSPTPPQLSRSPPRAHAQAYTHAGHRVRSLSTYRGGFTLTHRSPFTTRLHRSPTHTVRFVIFTECDPWTFGESNPSGSPRDPTRRECPSRAAPPRAQPTGPSRSDAAPRGTDASQLRPPGCGGDTLPCQTEAFLGVAE